MQTALFASSPVNPTSSHETGLLALPSCFGPFPWPIGCRGEAVTDLLFPQNANIQEMKSQQMNIWVSLVQESSNLWTWTLASLIQSKILRRVIHGPEPDSQRFVHHCIKVDHIPVHAVLYQPEPCVHPQTQNTQNTQKTQKTHSHTMNIMMKRANDLRENLGVTIPKRIDRVKAPIPASFQERFKCPQLAPKCPSSCNWLHIANDFASSCLKFNNSITVHQKSCLSKTNSWRCKYSPRHSQNSNHQSYNRARAVPTASAVDPASAIICNHLTHSKWIKNCSKTDLTSWFLTELIHANFYLNYINEQKSNSHVMNEAWISCKKRQ